jgi:hypothetical protein
MTSGRLPKVFNGKSAYWEERTRSEKMRSINSIFENYAYSSYMIDIVKEK